MNFTQLFELGQEKKSNLYFSCKIKGDRLDIYDYSPTDNKKKLLDITSKSEYSDIIGYGELTTPTDADLIPVTLTEEFALCLLKNRGIELDEDWKNYIEEIMDNLPVEKDIRHILFYPDVYIDFDQLEFEVIPSDEVIVDEVVLPSDEVVEKKKNINWIWLAAAAAALLL